MRIQPIASLVFEGKGAFTLLLAQSVTPLWSLGGGTPDVHGIQDGASLPTVFPDPNEWVRKVSFITLPSPVTGLV